MWIYKIFEILKPLHICRWWMALLSETPKAFSLIAIVDVRRRRHELIFLNISQNR